MFSHIMVGANDVQQAKVFYDAILGTLGHEPAIIDDKGRCFYITKSGVFSITKPINDEPASPANGGTIGFSAESPEAADAWHAAGNRFSGTGHPAERNHQSEHPGHAERQHGQRRPSPKLAPRRRLGCGLGESGIKAPALHLGGRERVALEGRFIRGRFRRGHKDKDAPP